MLTGVDTAHYSAEVTAAVRRLTGVVERTPLQRNSWLSEATQAQGPMVVMSASATYEEVADGVVTRSGARAAVGRRARPIVRHELMA